MSQEKTFLIPKGDALEEPLRNYLNTTVIPSQYSEKAIVLLGPKCLNRACVKKYYPCWYTNVSIEDFLTI